MWLSILRTRLASMRMQVPSLASPGGLRIWRCHELWCGSKTGSDGELLGGRLAAVALIGPPAWERPYATGAALQSNKKKKMKMSQSVGRWLAQPEAQRIEGIFF